LPVEHRSLRTLSESANGPGVEIDAPELANLAELDPERLDSLVRDVHAVWLQHKVVVVRDLQLTPVQQAQICSLFGELDVYPFVAATDEHPNVIPIVKEPGDSMNFGGMWHTDTSYMAAPPKATCLYARDVPSDGGDTLFADCELAWRSLSSGMQAMLRDLTGVYTPALVHGKSADYGSVNSGLAARQEQEGRPAAQDGVVESRVEHPVIRTHPETGAKSIYATPIHCERFVDMTRDESLPLLNYLYEFATRDEFTTRLTWRPGTLALWDNRCLFHNALNDYHGQRREVHRVTLKGDVPQ